MAEAISGSAVVRTSPIALHDERYIAGTGHKAGYETFHTALL